jgi:hypothetical protein
MKKFMMAVVLSLAAIAQAQQVKTPVYVACSNEDGDFVGARLCTQIRDDIARSPRYRLLVTDDNSFHFKVLIVTIAPSHDNRIMGTAAAVVFGFTGQTDKGSLGPLYYLTHIVQTCGADGAERCGDDVIAVLDKEVTKMYER